LQGNIEFAVFEWIVTLIFLKHALHYLKEALRGRKPATAGSIRMVKLVYLYWRSDPAAGTPPDSSFLARALNILTENSASGTKTFIIGVAVGVVALFSMLLVAYLLYTLSVNL